MLTKQEILLGKGTRAESRRVPNPSLGLGVGAAQPPLSHGFAQGQWGVSGEERPRPGRGGGPTAPWVQDGKAGVQSLLCHQPGAAGAASSSTSVCLSFLQLSRNCWAS